MIAGIDSCDDIEIYLENYEVEDIFEGNSIEGTLIRVHRPSQKGRISLGINHSKRNLNGCGMGIENVGTDYNNVGEYRIYISREGAGELSSIGSAFARHRLGGLTGKIDIRDISKIEEFSKESMSLENLQFYLNN